MHTLSRVALPSAPVSRSPDPRIRERISQACIPDSTDPPPTIRCWKHISGACPQSTRRALLSSSLLIFCGTTSLSGQPSFALEEKDALATNVDEVTQFDQVSSQTISQEGNLEQAQSDAALTDGNGIISVSSREERERRFDVNREGTPSEAAASRVPLGSRETSEEAAKRYSEAEEGRKKASRKGRGRIRELEEIRAELAEKELALLQKEAELLEKEQTVMVLREELEIERRIRTLLTKEKEKAEEEAALAMGLCSGASMLP